MTELTRRHIIGATAGLAGAAAIGSLGATPALAADAPARTWTGSRSANGWEILAEAASYGIEGSGRSVRLAGGDAATILLHVARRFHYEIDELRADDVRGHRTSRKVRESYESNHLSGTAIEIRRPVYPLGSKGNFYEQELVVIRDILVELDGAVAWGGDFATPKESHFEIALKPGHPKIKGVARKIEGWNAGTGREGAGSVDAFAPDRREKSRAFARRTAG
ncbi:hypothetical protein [Streptomyces fulvorobeus]|uniref:Peptidase M15C domain-containing protein n=1 Tax=Streptomyces fulvorobeus TaxID=284028 RepID=A0A7J0CCU9_9ACTN|nr:hypothetical protein [Streptomyces fulvorobeus]NYE43831.1 hypothetical protein [Streptomyces fulvorobeus]GFN00320.1 hypothetical protein Sfulv_51300 [Streptomyces fulvorobeus]